MTVGTLRPDPGVVDPITGRSLLGQITDFFSPQSPEPEYKQNIHWNHSINHDADGMFLGILPKPSWSAKRHGLAGSGPNGFERI